MNYSLLPGTVWDLNVTDKPVKSKFLGRTMGQGYGEWINGIIDIGIH